jgi:hypothetical protein
VLTAAPWLPANIGRFRILRLLGDLMRNHVPMSAGTRLASRPPFARNCEPLESNANSRGWAIAPTPVDLDIDGGKYFGNQVSRVPHNSGIASFHANRDLSLEPGPGSAAQRLEPAAAAVATMPRMTTAFSPPLGLAETRGQSYNGRRDFCEMGDGARREILRITGLLRSSSGGRRGRAGWLMARHLRKHSNEMVSRNRRQAARTTKNNTSTAIFRRVELISRRMNAGSIMIRTDSAGVPLNPRGISNW